jgi:membrane fusion protein (multidrug efflux system)
MPNRLPFLLSLQLFLWALTHCNSKADNVQAVDSLAADLPQEQVVTEVTVALVEEKTFIEEIETNGTIQAVQAADAVWEIGGIIATVRVRNGQRVEKGQVLAELGNREEELHLQKAHIALKEKQISFESELLGADSARQYYLKYHTGLAAAEVSLEEAKLAYDYTVLRAPVSGIVSDLMLTIGSRVEAGVVLCHVWSPEKLVLKGNVMETQLTSLKEGWQAMLIPLGSNETYEATLQEINPRVNEHGLVQVKLALKNYSQGLWPGQRAKAYIRIPHQKSLVIPKEAVVMRSGRAVAFTYEAGLARWKYLELGRENDTELVVLEGLAPQDSVITTNNLQLSHDARVGIRDSLSLSQ